LQIGLKHSQTKIIILNTERKRGGNNLQAFSNIFIPK
jgi:hypothetical protein